MLDFGGKMELIYKETLNSTNAYAKEHMDTLADMSFVYCKNQTNGKGRLNRTWVSDNDKNLYLTIVLKPQVPNYPYINLTQYLCVVTCSVLKKYGIEPQIKWPNDILINGKKIAGILAQVSTIGHRVKGIALGIGVNLNSSLQEMNLIDKPATSLNLEVNREINREEFLYMLANEFESHYNEFIEKGFAYIENDYISQACFINKKINVNLADKCIVGTVKNLTKDGALLLCENDTNKDVVITMGEIQ